MFPTVAEKRPAVRPDHESGSFVVPGHRAPVAPPSPGFEALAAN